MKEQQQNGLRFSIYARASLDVQNAMSIEAQINRCTEEIANRGGVVVATFYDDEIGDFYREPTGFLEMCEQAKTANFDAVMVMRFDLFATNYYQIVTLKALLRDKYNLKLYCVDGFSEDEDGSPLSSQLENLLDVFSEFCQRRTASDEIKPYVEVRDTNRLLSLLNPKSRK